MGRKWNIDIWLDAATSGIRFGPDRRAVERELRGHVEDKAADLQRVFHISEEEAESMALERMGDPKTIGAELAQIHRPWLGYLWRLSQVLAVIMAVVALYCSTNQGFWVDSPVSNWREHRQWSRELFPETLAQAEMEGVLAVGAGEYPVTVGEHTFTVYRASFVLNNDETPFLCFTVRGEGPAPWELPYRYLSQYFQITDSEGRLYHSRANQDEKGRAQVSCEWRDSMPLRWIDYEGRAVLYLPETGEGVAHPADVEGFRLEFDNGLTQFAIPIVWKEVAP